MHMHNEYNLDFMEKQHSAVLIGECRGMEAKANFSVNK